MPQLWVCLMPGSFGKFLKVTGRLHELHTSVTASGGSPRLQKFKQHVAKLKTSKDLVFSNRCHAVRQMLNRSGSLFRVSSFELMQHDFVENTHSNVLGYLFDP